MSPYPPLKTWLPSWIFLSIVWGLSFLFIKFALNGLSVLQIAFGRVALGAITVLIILQILKQKLPNKKIAWIRANIAGFFQHTAPFALIAYGETHVSSVLAGIGNAATPLWTALFALTFIPNEKISKNEYLGIEGSYYVECRDVDGNLKWTSKFPNLVNAVGKQLMLDTLLAGSGYTKTGP